MRSLAAALLLLAALVVVKVDGYRPFSHVTINSVSVTTKTHRLPWTVVPRGGASTLAEVESESEDESEEEEEEEEEELDPIMVKSAIKSTQKTKGKKKTAAKKKVSAQLASAAPAKKRKSKGGVFKMPYVFRAFLNPFTVIAMTKAYFASLVNLNYLKEDASEGLRSALEEKAKKEGGSGKRKGKRQMRPGQAKTLSDLPQLNT